MKTKNILFLVPAIMMLVMGSCVKLDLEDLPTTGNVTLVTDWTNRTQGIDIPSKYMVAVNNQTLTFENTTNALHELEAGTYPVLVHNTTDKISQNGTTVTVKTENGIIDPAPGWLFTATKEITYEILKEKTETALMVQQVRQLSFDLTITGGDPANLQSVTASLTGVANGMDFKANTYTGVGLKVIPAMTRENNKLKGSVRLIGLTRETQQLTLDIVYATGKTQQIISNVSDKLSNFNEDKHKAITLTTNMEITNQAGFEATIKEWKANQGSSGIAW